MKKYIRVITIVLFILITCVGCGSSISKKHGEDASTYTFFPTCDNESDDKSTINATKEDNTLDLEKLVYTSFITIKVNENADEIANHFRSLATSFNGFVDSYGCTTYDNDPDFSKKISMTLRIPSNCFCDCYSSITTPQKEGISYAVKKSSFEVENETADYESKKEELEVYKTELEKYKEFLKNTTSEKDTATIESKIKELLNDISRCEKYLNAIDNATAYSYINITLEEPYAGNQLWLSIKTSMAEYLPVITIILAIIIPVVFVIAILICIIKTVKYVIKKKLKAKKTSIENQD